MVQYRKVLCAWLRIVPVAAAVAVLGTLLPLGTGHTSAQSAPAAPQANAADAGAVASPVATTADAASATVDTADLAAPAVDEGGAVVPAPGQVRAPGPPRGPITVQAKAGGLPPLPPRPPLGAIGRGPGPFPGRYGRPGGPRRFVGRPAARPATLYRGPAVAPRLPNSGTGGLLDQRTEGVTASTSWSLVLAGLALGGTGLFAYRRQR